MMQEEQLSEVEQQDSSSASAGQRLRMAREQKELTFEDVAKHLKSNVKIIEALENEDSENLPQAIYVSGYLRSYANLLGLPADAILNDYPNLVLADPVIPKFKKQSSPVKLGKNKGGQKNRSWAKPVLLLLVIAVIAGIGAMFYQKQGDVKDFVSDVVTEKLEIKKQPVEIPEVEHSAVVAPEELPVPAPAPPPEVVAEEPVEEIRTSRLLLEFSQDSWVEVIDATGERLVYRLAKAPSRRFVEGVAPFSIFLGYAPGVTINFNGLPFDLGRYRDGDVAQLKIGTDEDNQIQVAQ